MAIARHQASKSARGDTRTRVHVGSPERDATLERLVVLLARQAAAEHLAAIAMSEVRSGGETLQ